MGQVQQWLSDYSLILLALAVIVAEFIWLMKCRKKLNMGWKGILLLDVFIVVIDIFAMRLLAIIEVGGNLDRAANIRWFGAVFAAAIFVCIFAKLTKRKTAIVADVFAVGQAFALILGRLDCLITGCCAGMRIPGMESLRWPLRELEIIFCLAFIGIFAKKVWTGKTYGQVYPAFMFSYGAFRFVLEWVREEYTTRVGIFHLAHIWALLSFCIGASIYFETQKKRKR